MHKINKTGNVRSTLQQSNLKMCLSVRQAGVWEGNWEGTMVREIGTGNGTGVGKLYAQNSTMNNLVSYGVSIKKLISLYAPKHVILNDQER